MSDDLRIIPERDSPPSTEHKGKPIKPSQKKAAKSSPPKSDSFTLIAALCLVVLMICGVAVYLYFQTVTLSEQRDDLNARLIEVEGKLSVTDESLSASGVAIQALLKEQKADIEKQKEDMKLALSEIDKLWGVSYRTNKPKIEAIEKTQKSQVDSIAKLSDTLSGLESSIKDLSTLKKQVNTTVSQSLATSATIDELQTSLREQSDALTVLSSSVEARSKTVSEHAEAIEAFDRYRVQINQKILQLENRN